MDLILEKIEKDIEKESEKRVKFEEKLKACNEKIKQLQQKKTEIEDSQMLASIKEFNVTPQELKELLRSIKGKGEPEIKAVTETKDIREEVVAV